MSNGPNYTVPDPIATGPIDLVSKIFGQNREFQKNERAIDLDYDALYKAGVSQDAIVSAVAKELGIDEAEIEAKGIDSGDFLYVYTNAAKPGTISALTQGLLRGITKETPAIASAVVAGKTAAKAPVPPALKGPLILGSSILGYYTGSNIGEGTVDVAERLGVLRKDPTLPENRFAEAFGESAGFAIPFTASSRFFGQTDDLAGFLLNRRLQEIQGNTGTILRAPGTAVQFLGRTVSDIGESARTSPKRFFTTEATMATGAALGAGTLDLASRGDPLAVAGGELGGGFLATNTPTGILIKNLPTLFNLTKRGLSTDSRELKFGEALRDAFEKQGADVDAIINNIESQIGTVSTRKVRNPETGRDEVVLDETGPAGKLPQIINDLLDGEGLPELTPAMLTNDPALVRFQNYVKNASTGTSAVDARLLNTYENAVNFYVRLIKALENQNTPEASVAAVQIREDLMSDLISRELSDVTIQAQDAAAKLSMRTAEDGSVVGPNTAQVAKLSQNLKIRMGKALESIRKQENELWNATPGNVVVDELGEFPETLDAIRKEYILGGEDFVGEIGRQLKRWEVLTGKKLITEDGPATLAAQKARDKIPPLQVKAYDEIAEIVNNPDNLRLFLNDPAYAKRVPTGREDRSRADTQLGPFEQSYTFSSTERGSKELDGGPFVRPDVNYQILDAIRLRRERGGLTPALKKKLNDAERVANANIRVKTEQIDFDRKKAAAISSEDALSETALMTSDIKKLRTAVTDQIIVFEKDGRYGAAKPYRELRDALDDLAGETLGDDNAAYTLARSFTRAKKDAIERSFIGDTLTKDGDGATRVREELLFDWLIGGNVNARTLKFMDIEDSATFVQRMQDELNIPKNLRIRAIDTFGPASQRGLSDALSAAAQYAAIKGGILDANGRVIPEKATNFINENQDLIRMYPQLGEMLQNGAQFEIAIKNLTDAKVASNIQKRAKEGEVLARLVNDNNPALLFSEAMSDKKNPYDRVVDVIDLVVRATKNDDVRKTLQSEGLDPDDAINGLKSMIIDSMQIEAGKGNKVMDFRAARQYLFGPMKKGVAAGTIPQPGDTRGIGQAVAAAKEAPQKLSLADVLVDKGVFTRAEVDRLEYILEAGDSIQNAPTAEALKDAVEDKPGLLVRGIVKILGSTTATSLAQRVGLRPQGIVEANIGAKVADSYFTELPETVSLNLLHQAAFDPKFMVYLLKKTGTEKQAEAALKQLKNYMFNAGLTAAEDEEPTIVGSDVVEKTRREMPLSPVPMREYMRDNIDKFRVPDSIGPVSQAPPSGTQPALVGTTAPSTVSSLAQAPSSPSNAARMAAAFPNDGIMGLLATRA